MQLITNEGITPNKFAKELGYKRSQTLYDALNKGIFGAELLTKLAEKSVNVNWLLTGGGEVYTDRVVVNEPIVDYSKQERLQAEIDRLNTELEIKNDHIMRLRQDIENPGQIEPKSKRNTGS